jgi:opacity protein-like surface antigen
MLRNTSSSVEGDGHSFLAGAGGVVGVLVSVFGASVLEASARCLTALATSFSITSSWSGVAGYAGYDWTQALRTVLRLEYFADPQAVRNGITAPGHNVDFYDITATVEYKIWRGLIGRLEYRHDQASRRAFSLTNFSTTPTSRAQDTFSIALSYVFF